MLHYLLDIDIVVLIFYSPAGCIRRDGREHWVGIVNQRSQDSFMQADLETRIGLLVRAIDTSDDKIKIKILQEIAKTENVNHLKSVLPLSKYSNKLTLLAAFNAARQILSRMKIGKFSVGNLPQDAIKSVIQQLDKSYSSWQDRDLESGRVICDIIFTLLFKNDEDCELVDLCYCHAGMVLGQPIKDGNGTVIMDAGTELSNSHLIKIKATGAKQIAVRKAEPKKNTAVAESDAEADSEADPIFEQLNERFAGNEHNETMVLIKNTIYEFLSSRVEPQPAEVAQS